MSFLIIAKGFSLGLSMIVPIGAQNSMILTQGINRNFHLTTAALCASFDIILIALGVLGGSALLASSDGMFSLLSWGGIVFLLAYGALSFKSAMINSTTDANKLPGRKSLKIIVISSLMVTFLNPHAYVDTVMVLGSVGGQYQGELKVYFMVGAMLASIAWFFTLAIGAARLSSQLSKPAIRRYIDLAVAVIMWGIAWSLYQSWLVKIYG